MKRRTLVAGLSWVSLIAVVLIATARSASAGLTTIDDPSGQPGDTNIFGIYGNTVFGDYYGTDNTYHAFSESGGVYITLTPPGADALAEATGGSMNSIVGSYWTQVGSNDVSHGFMLTSGVYTQINAPGAVIPTPSGGFGTTVSGIYGNTVVGSYTTTATGTNVGFTETAGIFQNVIDPNADENTSFAGTTVTGIYGSIVVGNYQAANHKTHGFIDSNGVYTTINYPGTTNFTNVQGIYGDTIVGWFGTTANQSFYERNGVFTTLDVPGAKQTWVTGIYGDTVVGYYADSTGNHFHGFEETIPAEVPAPSACRVIVALLALFGLMSMLLRRLNPTIARKSVISPMLFEV